jgi:hypothetical protein
MRITKSVSGSIHPERQTWHGAGERHPKETKDEVNSEKWNSQTGTVHGGTPTKARCWI